MPVILRVKGYRIWFYEADLAEPPHVHVGRGNMEAKYWVDPVALAQSGGFRGYELNEIEQILRRYREDILAVWEKEQQKRVNRQSQS